MLALADRRGLVVLDEMQRRPDHAALVIENGGTWITSDRDFARFAGLR